LVRQRLEAIRGRAAVMIGLARSPEEASERIQAVPKIAFVSPPQDYRNLAGKLTARRLMEGYVYVPEKYFRKA
jgi:2-methylaconitate cis-trans-isomerase PrpF